MYYTYTGLVMRIMYEISRKLGYLDERDEKTDESS